MSETRQPTGLVRRFADALTGSDDGDLRIRSGIGAVFGLVSLIAFLSLAQFIEIGGEFVIAAVIMLSGTLFGACVAGNILHYRTLRRFARYMAEDFDAFSVACFCIIIWIITPA